VRTDASIGLHRVTNDEIVAPTRTDDERDRAVQALFVAHYDNLRRLAFLLLGDSGNSEEVVMEAFAKALSGWRVFVRKSLDGPPDLLEAPHVELPEAPTDLLLDGNTLWAALPRSKSVARITSIYSDEWNVRMIPTDVAVSRLALGDNYVFGAGPDGFVMKVPRNGVGLCSVVADLGGKLGDIVVADGRLYVAVTSNDIVVRLDEPK
jgi:hypothetical protein